MVKIIKKIVLSFLISGTISVFLMIGIYIAVHFELYQIKVVPPKITLDAPLVIKEIIIENIISNKIIKMDTSKLSIFAFRDIGWKLAQLDFETILLLQKSVKKNIDVYLINTNRESKKDEFYSINKKLLYYQKNKNNTIKNAVYLVKNGVVIYTTTGYYDWNTQKTINFVNNLIADN